MHSVKSLDYGTTKCHLTSAIFEQIGDDDIAAT